MDEVVRIRQLAKEQGVKLKYLAEKLGVSATYFADVHNGRYKMSSDKIGILAELLHTTPDYIMFGGEKPSKEELTKLYMKFKRKNDKNRQSSPDSPSEFIEPRFDYDRFNERRVARHLTPDYVEAQLNLPEDYWEDVRDGYVIPDTQLINKLAVLLAATCGLRRSEICALDLDKDVDYDKGLIHIDKALVPGPNNRYVIKDTKTTAGERTVPCPAWVLDKLAQARDNPNYQPYKPNTITTSFTPIAKQCGVNCTFHGLRHYYASVMSALNIPEQYQMERMGHATNHMLKRYQEYLKSKEAEVNSDLMSALDNLNPSANNNQ